MEARTLYANKLMRHIWIRFIFAALKSLKSDLQNDVIMKTVCNMKEKLLGCEA